MTTSALSVLDTMRLRYMRGEPLMQAGDSFDFTEGLAALDTVNKEAKARGLASPIAMRQPSPPLSALTEEDKAALIELRKDRGVF